jgi:hypothetical protein
MVAELKYPSAYYRRHPTTTWSSRYYVVIPAKAGIALAVAEDPKDDRRYRCEAIPAFAGMTTRNRLFEVSGSGIDGQHRCCGMLLPFARMPAEAVCSGFPVQQPRPQH